MPTNPGCYIVILYNIYMCIVQVCGGRTPRLEPPHSRTAVTLLLKPDGLGGGSLNGVLVSIGAGLLYAGYGLSVRKFMHGMPPLVAFAAVSQYTGLALVLLMLPLGDRAGLSVFDLSPTRLMLLALSALIGIGLGHTLYFASIARLGLAVSAGVVQLQPITVSICSYFLFDERLTPGQWSGGLIAIAGAAIMLIAQARLANLHSAVPKSGMDDDRFDTLPVDGDVALVAQSHDERPHRSPPDTTTLK